MSVPWYLMAKGKGGSSYKTASGPVVSVNDALAAPLRSLVANIEPVQDLHGYDNPWPAGGGKNLFDGEFLQGYWAYSNGVWANSDNWIATKKIACKPSTTYTTSWGNGGATRWQGFVWYDSEGNYIYSSNWQSTATNGKTGTSPANAAFLVYNIAGYPSTSSTISPSSITQFQLEEGSTATSYAPYSNICPISGWSAVNVWVKPTYDPAANPTSTIQLGQTVYGGTLDVTAGTLTVDRAMVVFDGSQDEEWHDYSNYNGYYIQLTAMKSGNRQDGWSNMLKDSKTSAQGQIGAMWLGVNNSRNVFVIGVHDTMGETLSAFRSYLFEHPLELVYPLATPIIIPLTPTQISTLAGQNVLWADSGDVTAEYLASGGTDPNLMKLSVAFMGRR